MQARVGVKIQRRFSIVSLTSPAFRRQYCTRASTILSYCSTISRCVLAGQRVSITTLVNTYCFAKQLGPRLARSCRRQSLASSKTPRQSLSTPKHLTVKKNRGSCETREAYCTQSRDTNSRKLDTRTCIPEKAQLPSIQHGGHWSLRQRAQREQSGPLDGRQSTEGRLTTTQKQL